MSLEKEQKTESIYIQKNTEKTLPENTCTFKVQLLIINPGGQLKVREKSLKKSKISRGAKLKLLYLV